MARKSKKGVKSFLITVAIVLILAIVAGAVWYFFVYQKEEKTPADDTQSGSSQNGGTQGGSSQSGGSQNGGTQGGSSQGDGTQDGADDGEIVSGDLYIRFLELGNKYAGDCILLKTGDTEVLIDAGSRKESAATLVPALKEYCTDGVLEYVIATHADQDHIAAFVGTSSAPGIFQSFECKTIIDYARTDKSTQIKKDYERLRDEEVSSTEGAVHYTALQCWNNADGAQRSYEIAEGITMNILYQKFYENKSSDENNYSVCTLFTQGENNFLFTGDLEKEGEESLVQSNELPHVKLFKAGHHGSKTSSNEALLEKITPEIVCVCCCAGSTEYTTIRENTFPTQAMIDRVAKYTKNIYVTTMSEGKGFVSMNGTITVTSNESGVTVHGSNNDTILKDTDWFKENRTWPAGGVE